MAVSSTIDNGDGRIITITGTTAQSVTLQPAIGVEVIRVANSATQAATVRVMPGKKLNGTKNGTISIPAGESRTFKGNAGGWTMLENSASLDTDFASRMLIQAKTAVLSGTLTVGQLLPVDTTAGTASYVLPLAASCRSGDQVAIKNAAAVPNSITVSRSGSDVIYGTGSGSSSKTLTLASEVATFQSDGSSSWTVVASDTPVSQLDLRYPKITAAATSTAATSTTSGTLTVGRLEVVTSASAATRTLPTSATAGQVCAIRNKGAGTVTVNRGGSDTIDGGATGVTVLTGESVTLMSDGSGNWSPLGPTNLGGTFARPSGAWSSSTAYTGMEVVTYNGSTYRAVAASTNVTPGTDATKWETWGGALTGASGASVTTTAGVGADASRALRTFRVALAKRDTAPVIHWHIGHSMTLGATVTTGVTTANRYAAAFATALRSAYPVAGSPEGGLGHISVDPAIGGTVVNTAGLLTTAGTTAFSPDARNFRLTASGDKQVYTFSGTGADIIHAPNASGANWYWKVDGGSSTVVNGTTGYVQLLRTQIRGLSSGSHTLEIGWQAGGTTYIGGIVAYDGDESAGFLTLSGGIAGSSASTWDAMTTGPYETAKLYAPDLVTLQFVTNEYGGTVKSAPAAMKTAIQSIITKIKARTSGKVPSFVLLCPPPITASGTLDTFANYRQALYDIATADSDNVCVFDWGLRVNPTSTIDTAGGLIDADTVHPTAAGHAVIAGTLARFVGFR